LIGDVAPKPKSLARSNKTRGGGFALMGLSPDAGGIIGGKTGLVRCHWQYW
jgi:hypothetical protein